MAKSKLTDEFVEDFCSAISLGLSIVGACDYCSISEVTYYAYIKKAEEEIANGVKNSKYVKFFNRVKKAKASFKAFHMKKIREAAESGNWQASAWSLERCCPNEYGKYIQNEQKENGLIPELVGALTNLRKKDEDA
jgi:hypothetical protein